jgi:hypothetical protein
MKTFIINEEEKMRILEMHETATKSLYLSEQSSPNKSYIASVYNSIVDAVEGFGTDPDAVVRAIEQIQNKDDMKILLKLFQNKRTGYSSFEEMVNNEFEVDNQKDVEKLKTLLNKLGIRTNVNFGKNFYGDLIFKKDFKLSI